MHICIYYSKVYMMGVYNFLKRVFASEEITNDPPPR